jgi:hypothetical protein
MVHEDLPKGNYEERYFAFVDILGFQGLIEQLKRGDTQFKTLWHLLKRIHTPPQFDPNPFLGSGFRAQSISDAVAISTAVNANGLMHMFAAIETMATALLAEGYFIRGAIVKGPLYHDESTVFGEALVKAYLLERDVVRYPRVMIVREVVEDLQRYARENDKVWAMNYALQADDGPAFLNVLRYASEQVNESIEKSTLLDPLMNDVMRHYGDIRNQIQYRFMASSDNPRHFEKVQWFARYWNKQIRSCQALPRITGPGLSPEPAFWG